MRIVQCLICRVEFQTTHKQRKACSMQCSDELVRRRKRKHEAERKRRWCEANPERARERRHEKYLKYYVPHPRAKNVDNRKPRREPNSRQCLVCCNEFMALTSIQFCSDACRTERNGEKNAARREQRREYSRQHYLTNHDKALDCARRSRTRHRHKILERDRHYRNANRKIISVKKRLYRRQLQAAVETLRELIGPIHKRNKHIALRILRQLGEPNHDHGAP